MGGQQEGQGFDWSSIFQVALPLGAAAAGFVRPDAGRVFAGILDYSLRQQEANRQEQQRQAERKATLQLPKILEGVKGTREFPGVQPDIDIDSPFSYPTPEARPVEETNVLLGPGGRRSGFGESPYLPQPKLPSLIPGGETKETREFTRFPTMLEALARAQQAGGDPAMQAALIEQVSRMRLPAEEQVPESIKQEEQMRYTEQGIRARRPDIKPEEARTLATQAVRGVSVPQEALPEKPLTPEEALKRRQAVLANDFLTKIQGATIRTPQEKTMWAEAATRAGLKDHAKALMEGVPGVQVNHQFIPDAQGRVRSVTTLTDPVAGTTREIIKDLGPIGRPAGAEQQPNREARLQSLAMIQRGRKDLALPEHRSLSVEDAQYVYNALRQAEMQVSPSLSAGIISLRLEQAQAELRQMRIRADAAKTTQEKMQAETRIKEIERRVKALDDELVQYQTPGRMPPPAPKPAPRSEATPDLLDAAKRLQNADIYASPPRR